MAWSYHSVKELKNKFKKKGEVTVEEKRKLERYIRRKKKQPCTDEWSRKNLLKAEKLMHDIKQGEKTKTVEVNQ